MINTSKSSGVGVALEATLVFFIFHIFIAIFAGASSAFSTYYALAVFLAGAGFTLMGRRLLTACVIGYITGAEVLLRMTKADVFWEYGKYAVAGILILALLTGRKGRSTPTYLILYFLLLLPAVYLTPYESWWQWRRLISFNMSGPLTLCLCGLYFSEMTLDKEDLQRILTWLVAPTISIAFLALTGIAKSTAISWGLHSSKEAAGEFGPNQVSSILGASAFFCAVFYGLAKGKRIAKIIFIPVSIWIFIHAILTFSRGGVIGAGTGFIIFIAVLMRSRRDRLTALILGVFFIALSYYIIIPKLDQYTKGMLTARYGQREKIAGRIEIIDTTSRVEIMLDDVSTFKNNLLVGAGVGNSPRMVKSRTSAHTEWSRVLAEHGMLGVFSTIFLLMWFLKRYKSTNEPMARAIRLSFIASVIFYMSHCAMRMVLPSFMVGVLSANLKLTE